MDWRHFGFIVYAPGVENVLYSLKLLGIIAGMTAIVPLMIWSMTGSFKSGMQAWRVPDRYGLAVRSGAGAGRHHLSHPH